MNRDILDPAKNRAPETMRSVHLMGVGGVAMGALAAALKKQGYQVRGSDRPLYPPMSTFLEQAQVPVLPGYRPEHLSPSPDLVIVGNVITADNPEALELARVGLPYLSLPQALAHFHLRHKIPIVVAGTHGKTTTTALVASALLAAGKRPGFMVGGLVGPDKLNFSPAVGEHFVVEGDEYDTAFFDKRPKFVHYLPRIGILTSLEFDHADIYADLTAVRAAFAMLVSEIPADGLLIAWGESDEVMAQAAKAACRVETYGRHPQANWRLVGAEPAGDGGALVSIVTPDGQTVAVRSPLAGEHNALNLAAALAALVASGLPVGQAARALESFPGVYRRQQVVGLVGGVTVVDDFAHHPTAVAETIKALARFGAPGWNPAAGRLIAAFEPRSNTSRRNVFQAQYATAFTGAARVYLREPALLEKIPTEDRFSSARLALELNEAGIPARAFAAPDELLQALLAELKPGDCCLVMSNGGFDGLIEKLLQGLAS